ncbi:hypothetical protein AWB61_19660 [Chromobacterium sp. F49]|nr:O-antigen ligase family protein [Chromobacterium subtsugae]KZE85464.1 hypothetical protein AWB61_19660 [Chromobacterium sp. F49]MBW7567570.1 O-antigen ligase family protein [Chromobacterium subtsugae]WSE92404.1 O-antigen ligase family protein [Chromobacterium subtsugae]WVH60782.1 O-antigen ligase family protein [Chromobacterium subtsugae]
MGFTAIFPFKEGGEMIDMAIERQRDLRYDWLVWGLTFIVIALGFVWRGSATIVACLLSLIGIALSFRKNYFKICWDLYRPWIFAMSILGLAIICRELISGDPRFRFADSASRTMLAIPLFVAMCHSARFDLKSARWIFAAAVFLMLIFGYWNMTHGGDLRIATAFTNTIPYSAFCLLFGTIFFLYSYSLGGWNRVASIVVIATTYLVLYFSESRGVWAAGVVAALFLFTTVFGFNWKSCAGILLLVFALLVLSYFCSAIVKYRIDLAVSEYHAFFVGKKDGSVSMRMDMALASWHIFKMHPIFGVGRDLPPVMHALYEQGFVGLPVADAADTHGELFFNAASLGSVGLLAYVIFYVGGSYPYWKAAVSGEPELVKIGKIGLVCNVIFFIVGYTHITLGLVMYASVYATVQAVLLSTLYKLQYGKASQVSA